MKRFGNVTLVLGFFAAAALAMQDAPPAPPTPPARPAPAPLPAPAATPTPAAAPMPPDTIFLEDQDALRDYSRQAAEMGRQMAEQARQQVEQARQQAERAAEQDREAGRAMAEQAREQAEQAREQGRVMAEQAREEARRAVEDMRLNLDIPMPAINLNLDLSPQMRGPAQPIPAQVGRAFRVGNDSSLYGRGQSALDDHKYDQALDYFSEVVARGGPRADGALYWKAYTLNKLGRRDDAEAAIAQLRTSFPSSHWLDEAKALELEVKQDAGKPVSPESESDDDLKLMALNGLAQTDPARAFPLLEKLLKGPASPKLKKNAIYVLAINTSPQAQQLLEQIARGNSNPDLQLTAISYMLRSKQFPNRTQTLFEIYGTTNDPAVKREIINALRSNGDAEHLAQIYKAEKDSDLRRSAISGLGDRGGSAELWQLYQAETTPEGKIMILDAMHDNGSTEKLADVARNDKDPKVRIRAIEVLSSYRAANLGDTLISLYSSEQDQQVKREIIRELSSQRNAKGLVDLFHKEPNFDMKKVILGDLERMHTPEANELYMEILGK